MIRMDVVNHEPPTELEKEMLRFVNDKIADLVMYHIDVARDCDGENLEDVFPKRYYLNNKKKCVLVIRELYDTLCSDVIYDELIPIHRYVLFHVLEAYNEFCEYASDAPEFAEIKKACVRVIVDDYNYLDVIEAKLNGKATPNYQPRQKTKEKEKSRSAAA